MAKSLPIRILLLQPSADTTSILKSASLLLLVVLSLCLSIFFPSKTSAFAPPFKQLTADVQVLHAQYWPGDLAFLRTGEEAMVLDRGGEKVFTYLARNYYSLRGDVGRKTCGNIMAVSGAPATDGIGAFHLFDTTSLQKLRTFQSSPVKEFGWFHYIQFHESCSLVFTFSEGPLVPRGKWHKQLRVYDVASGVILYARNFDELIDSVVISPDFKHIVATRLGRFAVLKMNQTAPVYTANDSDHSQLKILLEPASDHMVVMSNDGFTHHNILTQAIEASSAAPETLNTSTVDKIPASAGRSNSLNKVVVKAYRTSNVLIYDSATKQFQTLKTGLRGPIDVVCLNSDGTRLAAIFDKDLALLNLSTGKIEANLKFDSVYPTLCALNSDARKIIIGTSKLGAREYEITQH